MENRAGRRRPEGTKFDFKLHFHASRVPYSGWDKLVVSLLSIETGRITVKTSKGIVRDGACQWPDPVLESTNLFQNPSTGDFNDKLYKLFVQMGSLRAGILGEATINLAEFVASEGPEAVSLPLRNCSAGTILHLKIQRLTPKAEIRNIEGHRISMLDQEYPGSVSEDNSSISDISDYPASGSLGSSASQNLGRPASGYKNSNRYMSVRQKDEPATKAALQPNSDINDSSFCTNASSITSTGHVNSGMPSLSFQKHITTPSAHTTDTDLYKSPEENNFFQPKGHNDDPIFSNLQSMQVQLPHVKSSPAPVIEYGAWFGASLPHKLEAAEMAIKELRDESLVWERQARKLAVEVETFKQKLAHESNVGSELKIKVSTTEAECNSLRLEVRQLEALKGKMRDGNNIINRREMEDCRTKIKVLQEELKNGEDVIANLQMQLCKTQDSNVNLLTAVTELELILEAANKTVEKLTEANKKLEQELFDTQRELEHPYVQSKDFEEQSTDEWEQTNSSSTIDAILLENEQRIKDLEFLIEEQTSPQQLRVKVEDTAEIELALAESRKIQSMDRLKIDEGKFQISDLQAKLWALKWEVRIFEQERGNLLQKSEKETFMRTNLEAEIVKLGRDTERLNLDIAARDNSIKELNVQLAEVKSERAALNARLHDVLEEREIFSANMDAEKACVLEKLQDSHAENSRQAQSLEAFAAEMKQLRDDLHNNVSKNEILESNRSELFILKEKQEAKISDLEELNSTLAKELSNVEMQLSAASLEQARSMHTIEAFKSEVVYFENQIDRLQSHQKQLEQELQESTTRCTEVQDALADLEMKMHQQQQDSEGRERTLRLEIDSISGCKRSLELTAKSAEEAVNSAEHDTWRSMNLLQSRLDCLSLIVDEKKNIASHMRAKIGNLQAEKVQLENSLRIMEERAENLEQLSIPLKGLDIKLKDAFIELDASKNLCSDLTEELGEKESALHEVLLNQEKQEREFGKKIGLLENELLEKIKMLSELESKLLIHEDGNVLRNTTESSDLKVFIELEERLRCLEAELKASKEGLATSKKDFLQTETELIKKIESLEAANEQLAAGLMDSGAEQLQQEIIRLQNQNSSLSRKEQELLSQMHTQEVLQEEVKRLHEANDLLEARLSKVLETAKNPFLIEKIVSLETELAEAVEANHMYKLQLKSVLDKQQLDDLDEVASNLWQHRKKAERLQDELNVMHERYSLISLKLAEAEADRGELMMIVKNLKGIHKK